MTDEDLTLRRQMVDTCRKMNSTGINQGTAGNLSVLSQQIPITAIAAIGVGILMSIHRYRRLVQS